MASRMSQACDRCWRRKQKCSRETPTCHQCLVVSSPCIQRRFGSVIDASDPSSISYIESLKSRIRNLEAQSNERTDIPQDGSSTHNSPLPRRNSSFAQGNGTQGIQDEQIDPQLNERRPKNDFQDAMHEASYLSLSAMAESTERQPFSTQGLSFLTLLFAATSVGGSNPSVPIGANPSLSEPLANLRQEMFLHGTSLCRAHTVEAYRTFMEKTAQRCPFMTRNELGELAEYVTNAEAGGHIERVINDTPEKFAIVAIGSATGLLMSLNYNYSETLASELAMKAVEVMPRVFDHAGDLAIVKCLTALTVYSLYTTLGGSAWHLLGLAMTRCISSGMHTARASDSESDNELKIQNNRAFWALYMLDTYLSSTLDRPFCLNDSDIMVSPPTSPRYHASDSEDRIYRHLIQHAQILRSIRTHSNEDILCHFVNLRHWMETVPSKHSIAPLHQNSLYARGLIELLKSPDFANDPGRGTVMEHAEKAFPVYLGLLDGHLARQESAPASLDGHHVFAIGVILSSQTLTEERQKRLFQCVNILTILSTRYSAVRSLRDVLIELQSRPKSKNNLSSLITNSEISVSRKLQGLIFANLVDATA